MTTPLIRSETPEDITVIEAITTSAFQNAPHTDHNEALIVAGLRDANALTLSLVATIGKTIVGHIAVSPVALSDGSAGWFGIGPVAVAPEWQGRGIGSSLMRATLDRLSEQGASGCVVLGDPAYYQRFGFANHAQIVLPDVPPEYFMALAFRQPLPQGAVTYHHAFGLAQ